MAWFARVSTERPKWRPAARPSTQATEYRYASWSSDRRVMQVSRSSTRSVSTSMVEVSIVDSRRTASRTTPVRPMPPQVAQNTSSRCSGLHSTVSGRSGDSEAVDMPADGAVDVVVLAVDVTRDRTAKRDESRPWRDGREQPFRDKQPQQLVDGHAGLDAHLRRSNVEIEHTVKAGAVEDEAPGALRGVAIGAAETSSDHRKAVTLPGHEILQFRHRPGRTSAAADLADPAAAGEELTPRGRHSCVDPAHQQREPASPSAWRPRSLRASSSGSPPRPCSIGKLDDEEGEHEGDDRELEPHDVLGRSTSPRRPARSKAHRQYVVTVTDIRACGHFSRTPTGTRASADRCSSPGPSSPSVRRFSCRRRSAESRTRPPSGTTGRSYVGDGPARDRPQGEPGRDAGQLDHGHPLQARASSRC